MEYMVGGDVAALLKHVGYLEERVAKIYVAETILALAYLHR